MCYFCDIPCVFPDVRLSIIYFFLNGITTIAVDILDTIYVLADIF